MLLGDDLSGSPDCFDGDIAVCIPEHVLLIEKLGYNSGNVYGVSHILVSCQKS
jgi:hypothetical protein